MARPIRAGGLLTVLIVGAAMAGCNEDEIVPRAEYQRPTGLAFIERAVSITCPTTPLLDPAGVAALEAALTDFSEADRAALLSGVARVDSYQDVLSGRRLGMLMVADAEAEGVRVTQYEQFVTTSSLSAEVELSLDSEIVPGPVVFFPLVLSTPGFPTKVTAGKDEVIVTADCPYSAFGGTFTFTSSITRVEPGPRAASCWRIWAGRRGPRPPSASSTLARGHCRRGPTHTPVSSSASLTSVRFRRPPGPSRRST